MAKHSASHVLDSACMAPDVQLELEMEPLLEGLSALGRLRAPAPEKHGALVACRSRLLSPASPAREAGGRGRALARGESCNGSVGCGAAASSEGRGALKRESVQELRRESWGALGALSTDSCAFKFGKKASNVVTGRGTVVCEDIDPSGGMAVLQVSASAAALIIVGCPEERAFRLYQGNTDGQYSQCGVISVHDLTENVREGEAEDAPRFSFHVRSFAARFLSQEEDVIEIVAADTPRIGNLQQPPALFFLYLCRAGSAGHDDGDVTDSTTGDVTDSTRWTLTQCRCLMKHGQGPAEVLDPAAVAYVPKGNALVLLDQVPLEDYHSGYRVRVMDLSHRTSLPPVAEALTFDLMLDFYFKAAGRIDWTPMAVNENMDIVVALAFEIRKWNVKRVMEQNQRSSRPLKYPRHQWLMKRKAAFVPDNLDIGENTIEYGECERHET